MKRSQIVVKFQATDYHGMSELLSMEKCSFVKVGAAQQTGIDQHLFLAFLHHRDYFGRPNASLSGFSVPQGLFPPVRCIPISLFCSTEIISTGRMHLYLPLFHHKDYFHRPDSSLSCFFVPQGLFPPARCIPILLFFITGIISPRSDTSPIAENISARPFRQLPIYFSQFYHLVSKLKV